MNYKINWSIADGAFAVPDCVVDDYIKLANGKAVKVLLYILRHKCISSDSAADIAAGLDKMMSEEDVEDALSYWEQVGVICRSDKVIQPEKVSVATAESKAAPAETPAQKPAEMSAQRNMERSTKMLSPKEIAQRINESKEVEFLMKGTETLLGKVLTNTEQRTLIWMHDYYSMGTDIILMIVDFCKSIGKANIGFVEKIAASWNDKGISTHEQAESEIRQLQNYYSLAGQVVSRLGLNRSLTPKEREFVNLWAAGGANIEMVEYAYEKTINATGKVTFNYMNKIIEEWLKNNLRTIPEIDSFNERYAQSKAPKAPVPTAAAAPNGVGAHSYDLNLLLEHAMNNIPKVKGD